MQETLAEKTTDNSKKIKEMLDITNDDLREVDLDMKKTVGEFENITSVNPLNFPNYEEKIASDKEKTGLKEALRSISTEPLSDAQLEEGARHLVGFAKCLLMLRQEILENEGNNTNSCFNEDAGRRLEPACSK